MSPHRRPMIMLIVTKTGMVKITPLEPLSMLITTTKLKQVGTTTITTTTATVTEPVEAVTVTPTAT